MTDQDPVFPDFGLTPEQRHRPFAVTITNIRHGRRPWRIWCYTRSYAYAPGAMVDLHISSTASSCRLEIVRDGAAETSVYGTDNIETVWQETPDQVSVTGCGWEPTFKFQVHDSWPSGAYRITLTAEGRDGKPIQCHHMIIVLPKPGPKPGPHPAGRRHRHLDGL